MKHILSKFAITIGLSTSAVTIGLVTRVMAHEGHDHDKPAVAQAPKGGMLKSLEQTSVEVVSKGKDLKIYLYDKDMKPQTVAGYTISAIAELPRKKKTEEIKLTAQNTHLEGNYDPKGAHRYTLIVAIKDPKTGHNDKLTYTIEPKK